MNIFVFDIETVPDTTAGRILYDFHDLPDTEVAAAMMALQHAKTGSPFLRHHLQRIVAIAITQCYQDRFHVWSLGDETADEKELVQRFFAGIEKYAPTIVSWNGSGFDLPVLHYRALLHGISAPTYWDVSKEARFNNYLSRYHYRHLDLMDTLASYQNKAYARLDEIAVILGFPGKMGMSGSQVWEYFQRGEIHSIRHYCETDVLNTYLVYLRFELMRGHISQKEYLIYIQQVRDNLSEKSEPHWLEFLSAWQ